MVEGQKGTDAVGICPQVSQSIRPDLPLFHPLQLGEKLFTLGSHHCPHINAVHVVADNTRDVLLPHPIT